MHLLLASAVLFLAALLLCLHHYVKHAREDPATSHAQRDSCPEACFLQPSDVCNLRTCNHETWIILLLTVSWASWAWSHA
jgi:hypothetical protein